MKIYIKVFMLVAISCFFLSCNKRMVDPEWISYVQFVNESSHIVSAKVENTPGIWCKIYDFTLKPGEKRDFSYNGLGVLLEKVIITFDNEVTIVHHHRQSDIEGFRNMCSLTLSCWETHFEGHYDNLGYFTYRFLDTDYEFASKHQ